MLISLIKKEIGLHVVSLRFTITWVLFVSVIPLSLVVTSQHQQALRQAAEDIRSADRARLMHQESIDQQVDGFLYELGIYGYRPSQDLAPLAAGLEDRLPRAVHASWGADRSRDPAAYSNPLFRFFPTPDLTYLVHLVVSLLALLFVFDAVCGEKARGTLKILLANAVPRDQVLLAKCIGGYLALVLPFLIAVLGGLTYLQLTGALLLQGDVVSRLAGLVGLASLYLALCFALGLFISTRTHQPVTALLLTLCVWICWLVVIPNLAPVLGKLLAPTPTWQKIQDEQAAIDRETELRLGRLSRTMLWYGQQAQLIEAKTVQEGDKRKRQLAQYYQKKRRQQIDLTQTLSRLSPAASFTYASTELAQTGLGLFARFQQAETRFQADFNHYAEEVDTRRKEGNLAPDWLQQDRLPTLRLSSVALADTLDSISIDLLLMGVYTLLFFLASYVGFLRYDVT